IYEGAFRNGRPEGSGEVSTMPEGCEGVQCGSSCKGTFQAGEILTADCTLSLRFAATAPSPELSRQALRIARPRFAYFLQEIGLSLIQHLVINLLVLWQPFLAVHCQISKKCTAAINDVRPSREGEQTTSDPRRRARADFILRNQELWPLSMELQRA